MRRFSAWLKRLEIFEGPLYLQL